MKSFSELIDKLLLTSSRNRKIDILCDYFENTPDPDRGFTLAIICLLYTSPSPRDRTRSRMPSSA